MNTIALIPARGGSKRIPGKNIKMFAGKPLIAWTIEQAKKSKFIDRIVVSTDDVDIARVAKEFGAEVPFLRPKNIAEDSTPDIAVFQHFLAWIKEHEKKTPEIIAHLRVTSPMRRPEDIDYGLKLLEDNSEYDSVRAVIPAPLHPLKTYSLNGNNLSSYIPESVSGLKEPYNAPVQSLPKAYAAAGYFSAIRSETILEQKSMTGKKIMGFVVDAKYATDIDTPEDFALAELRMNSLVAEDVR